MRKVAPIVDPSDSASKGARPNEKRETLLYVEDDDENWSVAEYRLSGGYDMLRARDSKQACKLMQQHVSAISAILMDIELRGSDLDGIELAAVFRGKPLPRQLPPYAQGFPPVNVPLIFVTAHGVRYTEVELMLYGADKVIAKPVKFAALNQALDALRLSHALRRR